MRVLILRGWGGGPTKIFHRSPNSPSTTLSTIECAFHFTLASCGCWFLTWVHSLYGILLHERQCGGRLWRVSHPAMWHDALYQIHTGVERELLTGHENASDTAPHSWNWYWLEPFEKKSLSSSLWNYFCKGWWWWHKLSHSGLLGFYCRSKIGAWVREYLIPETLRFL